MPLRNVRLHTAFHNDILERLRRLERLVKYVDGRVDAQGGSYEKVFDQFVERTRQLQVEINAFAEKGDAVLCRLFEGVPEEQHNCE